MAGWALLWCACLLVCVQGGRASYLALNCGGGVYQQNSSSVLGMSSGPVLNSTQPGSLVYQSDAFFTGQAMRINNYSAQVVFNTSDPALYLSDREGQALVYQLALPAGSYTLALLFAELDPLYQGNSMRVFDVLVQGQLALSRFDIFNVSGGASTAYIASLAAVVGPSQLLTVELRAEVGYAKLNALLVISGSTAVAQLRAVDAYPPPNRTLDINAGGGVIGNQSGTGPYGPDAYFVGGLAINVTGVANPGLEGEVFSTARTGSFFQYFLNLPPGDYAVSLYFVDTNSTAAGQRQLDVLFDETKVLASLDVYATASGSALILTKAASIVSGLLTLTFIGLNNMAASIAAIKVAPINVGGNQTSFALDVGSPVATLSETGILYQADNGSYFLPGAQGNVSIAPPGVNLTLGTLPNGAALFFSPALYATARVGSLNLSVPLPKGDYLVDLEFADFNDTSAGARLFSVMLNSQVALANLDLAANTSYLVPVISNATQGAANVKDQLPVNGTSMAGRILKVQAPANVTGGNLSIALMPVTGAPPFLSALYVHPDIPNRAYVTPIKTAPLQALAPVSTPLAAPGPTSYLTPTATPTPVLPSTATATPPSAPPPTPMPTKNSTTTSTSTPTPTPTTVSVPTEASSPSQPPTPTPSTTTALQPSAQAPASPAPTGTSTPSPTPTATPQPPAQAPASAPPAASPPSSSNGASGGCAVSGGLVGIDCSGGCPPFSATDSVAVNCGSANAYTSTCGVQFLADNTPCDPGDVIPDGSPYCRTNIKGPDGGYAYPTSQPIAGTADPTLFQTERIGFNTYKFRLDNGLYHVAAYFAEISGDDPGTNVNQEGLRVFTLIFNDNPNSPISNIDPFKLAGDQKFVADPVQSAQIQVTAGLLKIQLFPTGLRDAPAIKGLWVQKVG